MLVIRSILRCTVAGLLLAFSSGCQEFLRQPKHELIAPFTSDAIRRKPKSKNSVHSTEQPLKSVPIIRPSPAPASTTDDIELVWQAGNDSSDGYRIRYGYTESDLRFDIKLARTDLQVHNDPRHGAVFRYTLEKIPANRPLYFTVAAYRGNDESAPSPVFEVKPK